MGRGVGTYWNAKGGKVTVSLGAAALGGSADMQPNQAQVPTSTQSKEWMLDCSACKFAWPRVASYVPFKVRKSLVGEDTDSEIENDQPTGRRGCCE